MNKINKILLKKRKNFAPKEKVFNPKKIYSRKNDKQLTRSYLCRTD